MYGFYLQAGRRIALAFCCGVFFLNDPKDATSASQEYSLVS